MAGWCGRLIRYSYNTVNNELSEPAPARPAFELTREQACAKYPQGVNDPNCISGNLNWLGTDDQGRDVVARLIYGYRISVAFGLVLTVISSVVGIAAGAIQGYFGGWTDLLFQRFIDIWTAIPLLYLLIILASVHHADLLDSALHHGGVFVGGACQRRARRIPQGAKFRVCARRSGTRSLERQDHVQAPPAQCSRLDGHLHAVHRRGLGHDTYSA